MDNEQNSDTYMMERSLVLHIDENQTMYHDDALARRLKNRERQRRYRARKREAYLKKSTNINQQLSTELLTVPVQVDISVNLTSPDCLTSVRCQRDWKKDARRAHKQEIRSVDPSHADMASETRAPSRRHWKEEARNKKSSE